MYCICGHCLIGSGSRRKFNKLRLDALSIPNYVIKKGATHGDRHGKTEVQREYHMAWNAWKRCCKQVDLQSEHFTGIHDRFFRDPAWTEQKCKEWDEFAKADHTCKLTPEEKRRYKGHWYLTLNKTGKNGPAKLQSDFGAAVLMKNRLHHNSGEPIERAHPSRSAKTHTTRKRNFLRILLVQRSNWSTYRMAILAFNFKFLVVARIRMELEVSSLFFFESPFYYSWFRLQLVAIHCNRRAVWTEHPHTSYFLAHLHTFHPHAPHGSRCRTTCLHKRALIHMSPRVWSRVVSPCFDPFLSFECLYFLSILFISSILVIILHVVETAEY